MAAVLLVKQIVPQSWIDDIYHQHDNHIWLQQQDGQGPRLFVNGNYRSQWYRPDQTRQIACAIGIHGQWLWVDLNTNLVVVRFASRSKEIDDFDDFNFINLLQTMTASLK